MTINTSIWVCSTQTWLRITPYLTACYLPTGFSPVIALVYSGRYCKALLLEALPAIWSFCRYHNNQSWLLRLAIHCWTTIPSDSCSPGFSSNGYSKGCLHPNHGKLSYDNTSPPMVWRHYSLSLPLRIGIG